jgi:polyribonucleotide nucleotidyltransferase
VSSKTFTSPDRAPAVPSRAQLTVLVECLGERELTPNEAALLQAGVEQLVAERDDAVRQRDEALAEAASALQVSCRYCKAPIGRRCVSKSDGTVVLIPHTARLDSLRRRLEVAS